LAVLNDERAVLTIPGLVLLILARREDLELAPFSWIGRKLLSVSGAFVAGVCVAVLVRKALEWGFIGPRIETPQYYKHVERLILSGSFHAGLAEWATNVLMGFRLAWLLPLYAIFGIWKESAPRAVLVALLTAWVTVSIFALGFNGDVQRGISFLWPAFIFPLAIRDRLPKGVIMVTATNFILPFFFLGGDNSKQFYFPLIITLWRTFH
jgi:hypothetical protein